MPAVASPVPDSRRPPGRGDGGAESPGDFSRRPLPQQRPLSDVSGPAAVSARGGRRGTRHLAADASGARPRGGCARCRRRQVERGRVRVMAKRWIAPLARGRIRLRLLDERDLPMTLLWRNQDHIRRWLFDSRVISPEEHRAWFDQYRERDDDFVFVIE